MQAQASNEFPSTEDAAPSVNDVVEIINPSGAGNFLIVCEHASCFIPDKLGNLGLEGDILQSHIAWDPGALAVAKSLSKLLDSPLVAQRISRLVYDCNRPLNAASAIPEKSEIFDIPGNTGLAKTDRQERFERYYVPFRDAIRGIIEQKISEGLDPVILTIHSFTPIFGGVRRNVDIGIIHDNDSRLADTLLENFGADGAFVVRRNDPYGPQDGVTHSLVEHARRSGLLNVMFEIKNDLIGDEASQQAVARWISKRVAAALEALTESGGEDSRTMVPGSAG